MWCERVVRNVAGDGKDLAGRQVDFVDIEWDECKSVLKKRTCGGAMVNVLLPRSQKLKHGDVLFEDEQHVLVVNVVAAPMVVVRPPDARAMALLALELGNLHWPVQIGTDEMIFPPSDAPLEIVKRLGFPWSIDKRRFAPQPLITSPQIHVAEDMRLIRAPL